jgi:hypothetical protein
VLTSTLLVRKQIGTTVRENSIVFPQKKKKELYMIHNSTLGMYPKEGKGNLHYHDHYSSTHNSQDMKTS